MNSLWPWLAIAGLGSLHGLSPANGWMFAAASGLRAGDAAQARRALLPMAIGHAASIALVALAVAQGLALDRPLVQGLSGALLIGVAVRRCLSGSRDCTPIDRRTGHAGIALWSFLMATGHGAGLMLVPALVPLCLADNPARELTASGSIAMALAAIGVHTAAMLATTAAIASGVCRAVAQRPRLSKSSAAGPIWTAALAVTGLMLMLLAD